MAKQDSTPATATPAARRKTPAPPGTKRNARPAPTPPARPAPARAATTRPRPPSGIAARWAGVQRFYRETVAELRRVQWPDRLTTRNLTLVVIGMSVALSAVLGAFDLLMTKLFQWLL
ncbi:MAG TPA: preprotein translocase subunit SecE [Thermomicrobiales bacterium]|nr:preprotein translocase subunit SecE [Thermomicrobiales bacterium]